MGMDIVLLTGADTPTQNSDFFAEEFANQKANLHLLYFGPANQTANMSSFSVHGSLHYIPIETNDSLSNPYTFMVNTLHTIYSNTHVRRQKVKFLKI